MNGFVTQQFINNATAGCAALINREKLPFERESLTGLTLTQRFDRTDAIIKQLRDNGKPVAINFSEADALAAEVFAANLVISTPVNKPVPGVVLAGADGLPQPSQTRRCVQAAIMPYSHVYSEKDFWERRSGIKIERAVSIPYDMAALHEAGHAIFVFDDEPDGSSAYAKELYSDVFALTTHMEHRGSKDQREAWVHERAFSIFSSDPSHMTAPGCVAALTGEAQPNYIELGSSTIELWLRVYDAKTGALNIQGTDSNALHEIFHEKTANPLQWCLPDSFLDKFFKETPQDEQFRLLATQINKREISCDLTNRVAELALEAFNYFRPQSYSNITAPRTTYHFMP